jgi:hypothetical protein
MPNVVVTPPRSISVRVGTGVLTGTQQNQINTATDEANLAITTANAAYILANGVSDTANTAEVLAYAAANTANTAYSLANSVSSTANVAVATANTAEVIAFSAYSAANTKFSANGGIINGNIIPANGNISLGSSTSPFKEVYVSSGTVWIDNIALSNTNNQFTITNETAMNVSGDIITSGKFFGIIDAGDNSF